MDDTAARQNREKSDIHATVSSSRSSDAIRHSLRDVAKRLNEADSFEVVFETNEITVELYAPNGTDNQEPHNRDEIYIIAEGTGTFSRDAELVPFGPGDLLFVPAHVPHRFETFSDYFRTWVIFYGEVRLS